MRPSKLSEAVFDLQFIIGEISDRLCDTDYTGPTEREICKAINVLDSIASEADPVKLMETETPVAILSICGLMRRVFPSDSLGSEDADRLELVAHQLQFLLSHIPPPRLPSNPFLSLP